MEIYSKPINKGIISFKQKKALFATANYIYYRGFIIYKVQIKIKTESITKQSCKGIFKSIFYEILYVFFYSK